MARLVRRRKDPKTGKSKVVEVISDTKKGIKADFSKEKKKTVLPTIEAKRPEKKTLLGEAKKQIEKTTIIAGVEGRVPIGVKASLASLVIPASKAFKFLTKNKDKFPFIANKEIIASAAKVGVKLDKKQTAAVATGLGKARVKGITDIITAKRFPSNAKSVSLTQKLWLGLGLGVSAAFAAKDIYGTYPYAEFIGKEEALQTVGIPIFLAIQAGDLEGAEQLIAEQKEIIASDLGNVPYKNIRNAIEDYVEAQQEAIIEFERLIENARGEIEFEGTTVGKDIAARDIRQQELQEERDVAFKESEERREERDVEFREAEERRKQEKIDELEFESEFFRLIKEGKDQEARDLQAIFINKLKGGN